MVTVRVEARPGKVVGSPEGKKRAHVLLSQSPPVAETRDGGFGERGLGRLRLWDRVFHWKNEYLGRTKEREGIVVVSGMCKFDPQSFFKPFIPVMVDDCRGRRLLLERGLLVEYNAFGGQSIWAWHWTQSSSTVLTWHMNMSAWDWISGCSWGIPMQS